MRILLIEDNPGDARLVRETLREAGGNFTISVAEKLGQGLEFLRSQNVDAVLLDLNLPDSSGLATLSELQNRFFSFPIVIMTSLDDEELAHQAVRLGAQDYLVKGNVNGELLRRTLVHAVERKQAEREREITVEFLRLVNDSVGTDDLIKAAATFFQVQSGCGAVGIRLRKGDDFPYYEARGFPKEFVLAENSLCAKDALGHVLRDDIGNPVLACMCGNIICGHFDPSKSFFTEKGSFWTNSTTHLLATTTEADRQARTRNRCNGEGYESVALIALRSGEERWGLLQLNDKQKGCFTPDTIALWERLADYLTVALSKFAAEDALRKTRDELELRVEVRTKELNKLNETLEQRVTERTAELLAANETLRTSRRASLNLMEDAVAARKDTEKANLELRRSAERFELLAATAGELLQAPDPQKAVESLCTRVMTYVDCHAFFNFLADEQAGKLHLNACAGIPEEEAKRIEWLDFGVAVCGCAARDGERIIAEHIPTTPDERTELVKSYGLKAYCCHPLLGPGGKVIGTLSFGTKSRETFSEDDISLMKAVTDHVASAMTRKRSEQEILGLSEDMAARNTELEALNKELEAFNYSISHDLRAPLRTMAGFSKMLIEDYRDKLDDQCRDYLDRITNASDKMTQLINDLLRLSRISRQDIDRMEIDLSKLAESAVAGLRAANPGRNVEIVSQPGIRASADLNLMRVVMTNLLDNAWKFTGKTENARVEFGACSLRNADCGMRNVKSEPNSEIRNPQSAVVYFVCDNGAGFDQQFAEKMFLPFHRLHTEKEFEGTGIGLAIVERIVRRHGGKVWAEGEVGKGATVFFTLG